MSTATDKTVTVTFNPTAINIQSDIIGPATATKAGVMTAAQAEKLAELGPGVTVILWTLDKTFTDIEAELLAVGNSGIVLVQASDLGISQKISGTNLNFNRVIFYGVVGVQGIFPVLEFLPGSTLIDDGNIQSTNIAWLSTDHVGNGNFSIQLTVGGWGHNNATVPAFEAGTSGTFYMEAGAVLFAGMAAPVFRAGAGKVLFGLVEDDSFLYAKTIGADAGGTVFVDLSATTQITQPVFTGAGTFITNVHDVLYEAASAPNWNGNPPATVKEALDRIAAKIGPIA